MHRQYWLIISEKKSWKFKDSRPEPKPGAGLIRFTEAVSERQKEEFAKLAKEVSTLTAKPVNNQIDNGQIQHKQNDVPTDASDKAIRVAFSPSDSIPYWKGRME